MRIVDVETIVVETPAKDRRAADQTHEAALVLVTADDGSVGVGEPAAAPSVVRAFIAEKTSFAWSRGVRDILVGQDPRDPRRLWAELYEDTTWSGRVGLGHIALAGVDMALWDLAGKVTDQPVWRLLDGDGGDRPTPYLTVYSGPSPFREAVARTLELLDEARAAGYRAAKVEALTDNTEDDDEIVVLVSTSRAHVGDDLVLGVDVGYRWRTADEALRCVRRLDGLGLAFLETPFPPHQVDDYRRLVAASPVPIAGAEILTSHAEYAGLLDAGVAILQAGTCRLGITECDRLARTAAARGRRFVPYGYVSTLFPAVANIHVAAANANVPLVEMAPTAFYPHMLLRDALAGPEPVIRDGAFDLPTAPGLGVELDRAAVERFRVA
jgi:L-alanine-DL-glutamate epimerase-like enolase superfamily enzyme